MCCCWQISFIFFLSYQAVTELFIFFEGENTAWNVYGLLKHVSSKATVVRDAKLMVPVHEIMSVQTVEVEADALSIADPGGWVNF